MAHELPDGFIPKFFQELKDRPEQKTRRLAGLADEGGLFYGDEAHFPRVGSSEVYDATRLQELLQNQLPLDWVKTRATPKFVSFSIWDPDKPKIPFDMAATFASKAGRAIDRSRDQDHVRALAAAAANGVTNTKGVTENIVTIGDYDTVMDLEMIADAIVRLGTNEMFEGESVSIIAPFKLRVQNALDPYFAKQGELKGNRPWDDINWASYEKLPGNGTDGAGWLAGGATGVDIFVHAKSAVMTVANNDTTEINERLGARVGDLIGAWYQAAAAVVEPQGVIRIRSKLDFALLRKAIRTFETNPDMEPA